MACVLVAALLVHPRPLPSGAWQISAEYRYNLDEGLAEAIGALFLERGLRSVVDFGAGTGRYARAWSQQGLNVSAYDGATDVERLSGGVVRRHDLTTSLTPCPPVDAATSLEVAEHIPAAKQEVYLDNLLCANPQMVVLSWAPPHQRGNGHVNGRPISYVLARMAARGYAHDASASAMLQARSRLPWFRTNVRVFKKKTD